MQVTCQFTGMQSVLSRLNADIYKKVARQTLTRAANSGKSVISAQIRERFNIKKVDVDKKITIDLSGLNRLEASLTVYGQPISLTHFNPVQIRGSVQMRISKDRALYAKKNRRIMQTQGVKVQIIKGRGTVLKKSFLAHGKGGALQVFRRAKKARLPIQAQKVIGYTTIVKKPDNLKAIKTRILEQLSKEFRTNLVHYAGKTSQ